MIALAEERPGWAVGHEDETWWSRVARPALHTWTAGDPVRLVEQRVTKDDPDPKALACYGLLLRPGDGAAEERWPRFVEGRPVGPLTTAFLDGCGARLAGRGITTLALVWDNASWHGSRPVRAWPRAQREGGGRLIPCFLPSKSPWLNPIEPKWVHGKRRVVEPARLLTARELEERVCAAFTTPRLDHLTIPKEVA